jgi:hypothetical protein
MRLLVQSQFATRALQHETSVIAQIVVSVAMRSKLSYLWCSQRQRVLIVRVCNSWAYIIQGLSGERIAWY